MLGAYWAYGCTGAASAAVWERKSGRVIAPLVSQTPWGDTRKRREGVDRGLPAHLSRLCVLLCPVSFRFSLCPINVIIHRAAQETQTLIGLQGQMEVCAPTHAHTQTRRSGQRTHHLYVADTVTTCCPWTDPDQIYPWLTLINNYRLYRRQSVPSIVLTMVGITEQHLMIFPFSPVQVGCHCVACRAVRRSYTQLTLCLAHFFLWITA